MALPLLLIILGCSAMGILVQGQDTGFININCGALEDYYDEELKITYETDEEYVSSGERRQNNNVIGSGSGRLAESLRIFPNGLRNCYTVKPAGGSGRDMYLVRASFFYGNYDSRNQPPTFDLHIGVNYWKTMVTSDVDSAEIMYALRSDNTIHVCLINTGSGVPFISTLELRLLDDRTIYRINAVSLDTSWRFDIGSSKTYRYPFDIYDRIWKPLPLGYENSVNIYDSAVLESIANNNNPYQVPKEVLSTAQGSGVDEPFTLYWDSDPAFQWCIYFHFVETKVLPDGKQRKFNIFVNDDFSQSVNLEYLKPVPVASSFGRGPKISISLDATNQSREYPPILNAIEIFRVIEHSKLPTASDDVNAIYKVKKAYGLTKDTWQGDPCVPKKYSWVGLNCTDDHPPKIVSLNLSSSKLSGDIVAFFSDLKHLVSLDLSYNNLTGKIPESLGELLNLKFLDLSGNNLNGSVPQSLQNQTLDLRVKGNPGLCFPEPCHAKNNNKTRTSTIRVVASVATLASLSLVALLIAWRVYTNKGKGHNHEGKLKLKHRPFTYAELMKITNNFQDEIGEGGFGKVYVGTLPKGEKVAVKMLSPSSAQGFREFQAEAQLLMLVYHKNLVALVGYCDDVRHMALIYEFMENGNLRQHISSGRSSNILTWKERIRIAVDAAQGLDYLHNGCKPPIIHRDLKTANILLNERKLAKIADFGLSRAFPNEYDTSKASAAGNDLAMATRPAGTPGYLDPEFQLSGNLNKQSDVYSFGIILLELITGRTPIMRSSSGNTHIVNWVFPIASRGDIKSIIDPQVNGEFDINCARKLVEIANSCVQTSAAERPDISQVLAGLKECWEMAEGH